MNLLKSTGFAVNPCIYAPFHYPNVRGDFRIFSNLLVSFHAFTGNFGKNVGKRGVFTNKILAQKMRTVKSTLDGREFS